MASPAKPTISCLFGLAVWVTACSVSSPDLILYNGKVATLDDGERIVDAVAIRDGVFAAVGSDDDILALAGPRTERLDLGGRTVVPGLADNHYHGIGGGPGVDVSSARTMEHFLQAIALRARGAKPGELVVTNSNWHEGQLVEQRIPLRDDLDRASPDVPVVVVRGGHEYILNGAGLRHFEIDRATPEPAGGRIGRYDDGRLNGELVDRAKVLVTLPRPPEPDFEHRLEALAEEHRRLNEAGLTSIRYPGAPASLYRVLKEMRKRHRLTLRVNFLFRVPGSIEPNQLDSTIRQWDAAPGEGDEWLRVGGVKLGVDGGFEGGWMTDPYAEPWGEGGTYYGLQTFPTERFHAIVRELNARGWRVATHAVGDAAIDLVLDAYEAADADKSIVGKRWVVEHGFVPRSDHFPRMRDLGILVSAQNHLYVAGPSLVRYWGADRAHWVTPVRAYLDAGIGVSSGTDSPVIPYNPFWTLYHFITRETISGGVMGADQRIGRVEALRISTWGNVYLDFEEESKGTIEPGKLADLVVLGEDFLTVPEKGIETMDVLMTLVGGRIVYRHADF